MLFPQPPRWDELELQAHWFAGAFGRDFTTTDGEPVRIVQFGVWNHEAGPDFGHAAISRRGEAPQAGAIELDQEVRDWERHGHAQNPAYEGVVLHVCTQASGPRFFTRTAQHRLVPQVVLDAARLRGEPAPTPPSATLGRCAAPLAAMPPERAREILRGAAEHRLRRKAAALARMAEAHGPDEALYQALAAALGYKSNKLPFTLLAQRLPLRQLAKASDEIEPLLFGLSGFLPERRLAEYDLPTRTYVWELWSRWWQRRAECSRLVVPAEQWSLSGQRPANHPQRRLAALAQIVRHWRGLRKAMEAGELTPLREFFAKLHDPYWDHHYTLLSKPAARTMALIGEARVTEMLLNVFLPLFSRRGRPAMEDFHGLRAPPASLPVETAARRLFGEEPAGVEALKSASLQQGLLQVYEDFCLQDASDCVHCRFPEQCARW